MSSSSGAPLEQILFTHPSLDLYRIPPRHGAQGYKSGEWRVDARIFTARATVVAVGDSTEVRLTDPSTGESFGVVPIPPGQRSLAVEPAADSSRNFVLRLVDPASNRAAFVGASFADRGAAFDFSVAIADSEKRAEREREIAAIQSAQDPLEAAKKILPEAATLFERRDLRLKDGEKIAFSAKIAGPKHDKEAKGGFLARLKEQQAGAGGAAAGLAAPPAAGGHAHARGAAGLGLAAPPQASAQAPAFGVPDSERAPPLDARAAAPTGGRPAGADQAAPAQASAWGAAQAQPAPAQAASSAWGAAQAQPAPAQAASSAWGAAQAQPAPAQAASSAWGAAQAQPAPAQAASSAWGAAQAQPAPAQAASSAWGAAAFSDDAWSSVGGAAQAQGGAASGWGGAPQGGAASGGGSAAPTGWATFE